MPTLDCRTRREGRVTLVACRLANDRDAPCRVRLDPAVDRVAPPRTGGYPASGWTDGRYETVIEPDAAVGVGFATPDRPGDPPATLTVLEADADPVDDGGPEPTATGAARSLLDPRPPRGAAPVAETRSIGGAGRDDAAIARGDGTTRDERANADDGDAAAADRTAGRPNAVRGADDPDRADGEVPPAVVAWLARVERRGDRATLRAVAERVTTAGRRIDAGES